MENAAVEDDQEFELELERFRDKLLQTGNQNPLKLVPNVSSSWIEGLKDMLASKVGEEISPLKSKSDMPDGGGSSLRMRYHQRSA